MTKEEVDNIYSMKKQIVDKTLKWKKDIGNRLKLKAKVVAEDGTVLELRGNINEKFSFTLLYRARNVTVRQFDFQKEHRNRDKTPIRGPHKHFWDGLGSHDAYNVNDVSIKDPNKGLFDFLKECNIEFNGDYQQIMWVK